MGARVIAAALLWVAAAAGWAADAAPDPGLVLERAIAPGESQSFPVALRAGQFVHLTLEQAHLDAVVELLSPAGQVVATADNVAFRPEPLSLSARATAGGVHEIRVRLAAPHATPGPYRLRVDPPRDAVASDDQRIAAERLRSEADHRAAAEDETATRDALGRYAQALTLWNGLGDRREQAATLGRMAYASASLAEGPRTVEYAERALALWRAEGDRSGEATILGQLGQAASELGEQRRALLLLERAREIRKALPPDPRAEADLFDDLGEAHSALGEWPEAIGLYTAAIDRIHAAPDGRAEARFLRNRATDLTSLGEEERALADLSEVLARFQAEKSDSGVALTEYAIGNVILQTDAPTRALEHYARALPVFRRTGDRRFEAFTVNHIGLAHLALGKPEPAGREFEDALALLRAAGDQRAVAMVRVNVGRADLDRGDPQRARERIESALPAVRASADVQHIGITLTHLARAERALGHLEAALARIQEALRLTESVRRAIPTAGGRASYLATAHARYALLVDILMSLHAKDPRGGWDAKALRASETGRARSLLEWILASRAAVDGDIDEALLARERDLDERIDRGRREEQAVLLRNHRPEEAEAAHRALETLVTEAEELEARKRASSPRYAALTGAEPLTVAEIQERVLDESTVLVEYALGEERSFAWVVSRTGLSTHVLPSRAVLEASTRGLREAWSGANGSDSPEAERRARALSRAILWPIAGELGTARVVLVADGALQSVPFAALPLPGPAGRPARLLVDANEIVSVPSATTLASMRDLMAARPPPARAVAVLADPVFAADDARVLVPPNGARPSPAAAPELLERSLDESGLRHLDRLGATRREAQAIARLAGSEDALLALDFQASRTTVLSPEVARARIIHIASHALLNSRHPQLSGIVLSLVDEQGRTRDGFLQAHELFKMRLAADLVVLSACQTALGHDVRGEGLLGLARGFMYAGAPRVLGSLWKVSDRATAELMTRFYRLMLVDGLPAAAALRAAQKELRGMRRFSAPYAWAAFTVQGEWR